MRILIIGAGEVGRQLAKRLSERGHSVTIIDKDEDKLSRVSEEADVEGLARDAVDPQTYEELDLSSFDVVVAATNRDEINLFIAAICKVYGVTRVYVRVNTEETSRILHMLGVAGVVIQPHIVANIMYSMIQGFHGAVELSWALTGDFIIATGLVKPTSVLGGKRIKDVKNLIPKGARILAIYNGEEILDPDEVASVEPGQTIIALVRKEDITAFKDLF